MWKHDRCTWLVSLDFFLSIEWDERSAATINVNKYDQSDSSGISHPFCHLGKHDRNKFH